MDEPGNRTSCGMLLGCVGLLCFPAACLLFALIDPPSAVVSPNYPFPSTEEKVTYLLAGLLLLGGGFVALRIAWDWSRRPEPESERETPAAAPAPKEVDEETRATVRRRTYWVAGVVGLVGTAVWVTGFLLGRHAPHGIRVRDGGELVIALLEHAVLTGVVAWVCYQTLLNRARR